MWYPEDRMKMKQVFRICATERLFLPLILSEIDAVVYLDTDLIFHTSPRNLWKEFLRFNSEHLSAMAPSLYHYGGPFNKVQLVEVKLSAQIKNTQSKKFSLGSDSVHSLAARFPIMERQASTRG